MSRSRLYLAAAGNPGAPVLNLSPSKMPQENIPGGIGVSKAALQGKLNKKNDAIDIKGINRDINSVRDMVT